VVALNIEDHQAESGGLIIRKSKNKRGRVLPIGDYADALLRDYLKEVRYGSDGNAAMFLNYTGKRISKGYLSSLARKLRIKAGIKTKATHHSLRKSSATHMLRNGASLTSVQALLGHETMLATQAYTKVYPKDIVKMHRAHHPREKQKNILLPVLKVPNKLYS
jgi:site-specific recombinase XerD